MNAPLRLLQSRLLAVTIAVWLAGPLAAQTDPARDQVRSALQKAVAFFDGTVSIEGGYLWRYSEDLLFREGEEAATATTAWLQPPGTPAVGEALLAAHERSDGWLGSRCA